MGTRESKHCVNIEKTLMNLTQTPPWRLANKLLPSYAILPLICCPILNLLVYNGGQLLAKGHKHYDFTLPMEEGLPVVPAWTIAYVGCFAVWVINFILICRENRDICYRFLASEAIAKVICGLFFVFLPTTNVRPELTGSDPFTWVLGVIYFLDRPVNLFPSIHCMDVWFAWRGLLPCQKVPRAYKYFSFVFAVLVFCSVLFTKQHVLVDIFGGVLVAEVGFLLAKVIPVAKLYERMNAWIGVK